MTANPLKVIPVAVVTITALEWAAIARDKNLPRHEAAWIAEARRRGEIPDHSEPRAA